VFFTKGYFMKIQTFVIGVLLSTAALADGLVINRTGSVAGLTGSFKGASSEILDFVARAYEHGFKDSQGADFFTKKTLRQGMRSHTTYRNKNLSISLDSAFTVIYSLELKGKAGDITVDANKNYVTVKGEMAKLLLGALITTNSIDRNGPPGIGRAQTKSGKVVCSRVVAPGAVPSCIITL
jgi:hypothetical protein